jgi:hypothetical protein
MSTLGTQTLEASQVNQVFSPAYCYILLYATTVNTLAQRCYIQIGSGYPLIFIFSASRPVG